jgi:hypothetical protein
LYNALSISNRRDLKMETNSVPQTEPKNNRNVIIGVVVAVVLCCCCVVTGAGGYYGYQAYVAAQAAVEDIQNFDIPTDVPFNPLDPNATPGSAGRPWFGCERRRSHWWTCR